MSGEPSTWGELAWTDVAERLGTALAAILPVGATEAHGPHLPLTTDVIIAEEAARRAARRLGERGLPTLALPVLSYVVADAAAPFAGTITIRPATLRALVVDIGLSLARQGVRALAIASAHLEPLHLQTLAEAAAEIEAGADCRVAVPDPRAARWSATLNEEFRRGARHGGGYETSLVWAVRPDLVRIDLLPTLAPVWIDLPARLRAGATTFLEAGGELAYFGDPASASPEEGHRLFDALAEMIAVSLLERHAGAGLKRPVRQAGMVSFAMHPAPFAGLDVAQGEPGDDDHTWRAAHRRPRRLRRRPGAGPMDGRRPRPAAGRRFPLRDHRRSALHGPAARPGTSRRRPMVYLLPHRACAARGVGRRLSVPGRRRTRPGNGA
jgi:creatinine amidohydrolase